MSQLNVNDCTLNKSSCDHVSHDVHKKKNLMTVFVHGPCTNGRIRQINSDPDGHAFFQYCFEYVGHDLGWRSLCAFSHI